MILYKMDSCFVTYDLYSKFKEIMAFTTTRKCMPDENEPRYTGAPADKTRQTRRKLAQLLKIDENQLVFPYQKHTSDVTKIINLPHNEGCASDAMITNQNGICLCIQTADCVPILLYDTKKKVIGAIHAGWRGTVMLIAENAVKQMMLSYESLPEDIYAVIGPSIGTDNYEVGTEVSEAVSASIPMAENFLQKGKPGKYFLNLKEANKQVLIQNGLIPEHIEVSERCTFEERKAFFSARRNGIGTGRIVTGIMLH
jgi:polyphenol oxidase